MSREWKLGQVAVVTGEFSRNETSAAVALRVDAGWSRAEDGAFVRDPYVLNVRPLVVIDPEDHEQAEHLSRLLDAEFSSRGWANQGTPDPDVVDAVQDALRSLVTDARPEEPQGLGAVVVAHCGSGNREPLTKVRDSDRRWVDRDGDWHTWDDLREVEVVREGWRA